HTVVFSRRHGVALLRLRLSVGRARFLGRRNLVCLTNLFLFRRLFDLRHRRCFDSWFSFEGQLPFSLRRDRFLRFLAALAHFAFHFSARLSLHSTRRQSGPSISSRVKSRHCHVSRWALAGRGLDVCRL